jgi:hypothetical protein
MWIRQCAFVAQMAACVGAGLTWSAGAGAIEIGDELEIHGFGSQDYLQASHNTYLGADHRGNWDDNFLGLVGTVTLNDRSKLWAQLETSSTDATRFTWFFVDYQLTGTVRLHAGRVKYPLGLYNEYIDTKFLQVTSLEPALYQEASDFVHDSYTGLGADYTQSLHTAGELIWQVYGGNTYDTHPPADSRDRRAYGGRLTYQTPLDGLRFMISAYRSHVEVLATRELTNEDRVIGSIDFVRDGWDIKSEYGTHEFLGASSSAWYLQIGRTVAGSWMPFVRYDHVNLDKAAGSNDSAIQSILVFGVNYKLLSNVSIRFEDHFNHGYALPVASGEVPPGQGYRTWNLFVAGIHFMF